MISSSVYECTLIELPKNHSVKGNISAVNELDEVPFNLERVYYLYDVPGGDSRGAHAHRELQQLIVAASGSFDITVDDGKVKRTFNLSRPNIGLYLPSGLWRELNNFSSGSICLVLASAKYSEDDYLRDYDSFLKFKQGI